MANRKSTASLLVFFGAALCFYLPFVTISCGGEEGIQLSGHQLATGTTLNQERPFGPPKAQKLDANPAALLAWLSAFAGLALSIAGRKMSGAASFCGGAGALFLLVMRSMLHTQIEEKTGGMATVHYHTGFVLAFLLLVTGAVWNAYMFLRNRNIENPGKAVLDAIKKEIRKTVTAPGTPSQ
jgi:hypothetical protein